MGDEFLAQKTAGILLLVQRCRQLVLGEAVFKEEFSQFGARFGRKHGPWRDITLGYTFDPFDQIANAGDYLQ